MSALLFDKTIERQIRKEAKARKATKAYKEELRDAKTIPQDQRYVQKHYWKDPTIQPEPEIEIKREPGIDISTLWREVRKRLPLKIFKVLYTYYHKGLTQAQTAKKLKISQQAVGKTLKKARTRLGVPGKALRPRKRPDYTRPVKGLRDKVLDSFIRRSLAYKRLNRPLFGFECHSQTNSHGGFNLTPAFGFRLRVEGNRCVVPCKGKYSYPIVWIDQKGGERERLNEVIDSWLKRLNRDKLLITLSKISQKMNPKTEDCLDKQG